METWQVAYVAGLFDGEGCLNFAHHKDRPTCTNAMLVV
jgi:hypothetical protein